MTVAAVAGLRANHQDLVLALDGVTDDEWLDDSACAGWRVKDVLAHITSNLKEIADPTPPSEDRSSDLTAEQAMDGLVALRRDWTVDQLLAEYEQHRDSLFAMMQALQDEPLASTPYELADLGTYPMHMLANALCFDHYCHLRHDLLAPAGTLTTELPAVDEVRIRPGIDWMWAGLPQMCSSALPMLDRPLRVSLTGPGGGTWVLQPAGDEGLVSVREGGGDIATGVTSSAHDFVAWGTKRSDWRASCSVEGDADYAAEVLDAIDII
ncbi:MAG: maleylpyruvate isomerase N-terminal domain-containing protein [Actinomycetota bacterium]|nr:maleylpyruvate isomerase N-terminal domain-containing protein [Actinomycetota bacterium]